MSQQWDGPISESTRVICGRVGHPKGISIAWYSPVWGAELGMDSVHVLHILKTILQNLELKQVRLLTAKHAVVSHSSLFSKGLWKISIAQGSTHVIGSKVCKPRKYRWVDGRCLLEIFGVTPSSTPPKVFRPLQVSEIAPPKALACRAQGWGLRLSMSQ